MRHSTCSYEGLVYIAGGYTCEGNQNYSSKRLSRNVYAYDTKVDVWLTKAVMNHARAETVLEAVNGKLFAVGGSAKSVMSMSMSRVPVPSIEIYDILENQWTVVENEPGFPYDSTASFVDGQNIVITGGWNYETKELVNLVHVFDSESQKITVLQSKLPNAIRRHACTVLKM